MQLVYTKTNVPVETGDIVHISDRHSVGKAVVEYIREPHTRASTGRVGIMFVEDKWRTEYYPHVIGADWIGRTDR